jgi:hypothetical protein
MRTAIAALFLLLTSLLSAQTAADSTERTQLARKLAGLMGMGKMVDNVMKMTPAAITPALIESKSRSSPEFMAMPADKQARFRSALAEIVKMHNDAAAAEIRQSLDLDMEMAAIFVPIYSARFDAEELKALIAFYEAPVGRKMVELMPQVQADAGVAMQKEFLPKLIAAISRAEENSKAQLAAAFEKLLQDQK